MWRIIIRSRAPINLLRSASSDSNSCINEKYLESALQMKLKDDKSQIHVEDISGGCGAMFQIHVVSEKFRGLRTVQQHKMVKEYLKDEIKQMHGIRVSTDIPRE